MSNVTKILTVAAVLAVQCLAIGWLIVRYERVVTQGTEVRFRCQAYDPYDAFRGRYLRTSVREATTNIVGTVTMKNNWEMRDKFVVRIEPSTNGLWRVAEAALAPSGEGLWVKPRSSSVGYRLGWSDRQKDESYEKFSVRQKASGRAVHATFPDQLFLNEKLAPAAEELLRKRTGDAVAVYRVLDGEMVMTDIELGGVSILTCAKDAKD